MEKQIEKNFSEKPEKIPQPAPKDYPPKKDFLQSMGEKLQNLGISTMLAGLAKKFDSFLNVFNEDKKDVGIFSSFIIEINKVILGADIFKGVKLAKDTNLEKVYAAFSPVYDLKQSSIDFVEGDVLRYNKDSGEIEVQRKGSDGKEQIVHAVRVLNGEKPEPKSPKNKDIADGGKYAKESQKMKTANNRYLGNSVAESFGSFVVEHCSHKTRGSANCALGVRLMLEKFGIKPQRGHAKYWDGFLKNDSRFKEISVNNYNEIPPGAILVFDGTGTSPKKSEKNAKFGHVEVMGKNGQVFSDYRSFNAGGSASAPNLQKDPEKFAEWKKTTGFKSVYIPISRA